MEPISRRKFFKQAGATAAVAGAATAGVAMVGVLNASPVGAVTNYDGLIYDQGGQAGDIDGHFFDVKSSAFGAKGDTQIEWSNGSIGSGSTSFTWSSGSFTSGDVGKLITIQGAGPSSGVLSTTISSYVSATTVVIGTAATNGMTNTNWAFGSDDTTKISAAISAAQATGVNGRLFAPPGIYMIKGASNSNLPLNFTGTGGLKGCGGEWSTAAGQLNPATMFLCADATAGILANGCATYEGFLINANNLATTPMQEGTLSGGSASTVSSNATFRNIWVENSKGTGWVIYGSQNNTYFDIRVRNNAGDGLYVDGGASGLEFWAFQEVDSSGYGIHGDRTYALSGSYGTSNIHFHSGILDLGNKNPVPAKIYLRGATNWYFHEVPVNGQNCNQTSSSPAIDLDQTYGYGIHFTGCFILGNNSGNPLTPPGNPVIQVASSPGSSSNLEFLVLDRMWFTQGHTSLYLEQPGSNYTYYAAGWMYDGTKFGPYSPSGYVGADSVLTNRTGTWQSISASGSFSGTATYRIDADGLVRLNGSISGGLLGASGTAFTLPLGYRPQTTIQVPVVLSSSTVGWLKISSAGAVSTTLGAFATLYLSGVSFPQN